MAFIQSYFEANIKRIAIDILSILLDSKYLTNFIIPMHKTFTLVSQPYYFIIILNIFFFCIIHYIENIDEIKSI